MSVEPTGRIEKDGERRTLVLVREFRAPIEDVWAAVTEPERLVRWLGTWSGDPTSGQVSFWMTAEGEDAPESAMEIRECTPPHTLRVTTRWGPNTWYLDVTLVEADGVTTLTFTQPDLDLADAESIGPGWEYYLDRMVAAETGGDIAGIDFERDYYPAMAEYYRVRLA
jgi:uncharacterized protein YndB with AHSA1/START domain